MEPERFAAPEAAECSRSTGAGVDFQAGLLFEYRNGARGESRTPTAQGRWILSPVRLPVPPLSLQAGRHISERDSVLNEKNEVKKPACFWDYSG